jgi:hypothetical protein
MVMSDYREIPFYHGRRALSVSLDPLLDEAFLEHAQSGWSVKVHLPSRTLDARDIPLFGEHWTPGRDADHRWRKAIRRAQLEVLRHYAAPPSWPCSTSLPADSPGLVTWALQKQGEGFDSPHIPLMLDRVAQVLSKHHP